MILKSILVIIILTSLAKAECPDKCVCSENYAKVSCLEFLIQDKWTFNTELVKELTLRESNIELEILSTKFKSLSKLSLIDCHIVNSLKDQNHSQNSESESHELYILTMIVVALLVFRDIVMNNVQAINDRMVNLRHMVGQIIRLMITIQQYILIVRHIVADIGKIYF